MPAKCKVYFLSALLTSIVLRPEVWKMLAARGLESVACFPVGGVQAFLL